jgi:hypothetical protein
MQAIMDIDSLPAHLAQAAVISEDWAKPGSGAPLPAAPAAPARSETRSAPPIELTDPRIKQALAATVAEAPDRSSIPANRQDGLRVPVFGADTPDQYKQFAKDFAYAKVPYCLGDNGLKFQPPKVGPVAFGGLLALPFVLVAKVRGKCK